MNIERNDETGQGEEAISLGGRMSFGVGAVGEAIFVTLFGGFITIYYNQVIGLSTALIGTAVMLALFGDAITDPIVGVISDRWKSRFGRRHPFLLMAPIPLALSIFCIFSPPEILTAGADGPTQMYLFAWLAFWTIISRGFLTLYQVPHLALGGELTKDLHQRSKLFSANTAFSFGTMTLFLVAAYGFFFAGERVRESDGQMVPGHLDAAAYEPLILVACVLVVLTIWGCAKGTWKYIPNLSKVDTDVSRMTLISFFKAIGRTLKNRDFLALVIGFFLFTMTSAIYNMLESFMFTYFWELSTDQITVMALISAPAAIAGALLSPILMRKFDRKPVMITSLVGTVIHAQLMVDLRLLGFMFENGHPFLLPCLLVNSFVFAFTLGINIVTLLSMIGDIIDANELETGQRQEGLFFSTRSFFVKASSSVGNFITGIVLEYYVRMPDKVVPGELDNDTLLRLGIAGGPIMAIAAFVSIFVLTKYNLNREQHQETVRLLEERKLVPPIPSQEI